MVGPLVGLCARNFKVDKFFLGIDGMDERGVKSSDHLRIEAAQAMAAQARGIIVLTESVKFHRDASELIFPYENIRAIYTDADVADSDIERCQTLGPEIVTAAKRRSCMAQKKTCWKQSSRQVFLLSHSSASHLSLLGEVGDVDRLIRRVDDVGLEHAVPRETHFDVGERVDRRQIFLDEAR